MNNLRIPGFFLAALLATTDAAATQLSSFAQQLNSSAFGEAAKAYDIDPYLLYAVALVESGHGAGAGQVSPHPYAIRSAALGAEYPESREAAETTLQKHIKHSASLRSVDVCLMQVNLGWNGFRVESPFDLLDLQTCISTGAAILRDALKASSDLYQAIGRYHTWEEGKTAMEYAKRVVHVYNKLPR